MGKIMGVDFGDRRTGIAVSDPAAVIAFPRGTIESPLLQHTAAEVARLAAAEPVDRIVVGHPLNMDGTPGPRAARTAEFTAELRARTPIPVESWDERLTSAVVERVLLDADTSRAKRRAVVDKLAAQQILQSWLDAHAAPLPPDGDGDFPESAPWT